jgi:hypothetical protein
MIQPNDDDIFGNLESVSPAAVEAVPKSFRGLLINHARNAAPSNALAFWADDSMLSTLPMVAPVAHAIVGSLGSPSKMPGSSWGISARHCNVGRILNKVEGSTCRDCYALKGNYLFRDVQRAHAVRLAGIAHPRWPEAMAYLLNAVHGSGKRPKGIHARSVKSKGWHRWLDSGDLQSVAFLAAIVAVCRLTPTIRHWVPTREAGILKAYLKAGNTLPGNLLIRVSATMIDGPSTAAWPTTSRVHHKQAPPAGTNVCPAPTQGNACGACRACWSHDVASVSYHKH